MPHDGPMKFRIRGAVTADDIAAGHPRSAREGAEALAINRGIAELAARRPEIPGITGHLAASCNEGHVTVYDYLQHARAVAETPPEMADFIRAGLERRDQQPFEFTVDFYPPAPLPPRPDKPFEVWYRSKYRGKRK